jgi:myo-inositol-1-phosphate synthase
MSGRIGVWTIGAFGGVAATVAVGLAAISRGLVESTALVSALPEFNKVPLAGLGDFVLGGHEIRETTLVDAARRLAVESRAFDLRLVEQVSSELEGWSKNVRPGFLWNSGRAIEGIADENFVRRLATPREIINAIKADIAEFAKQNQLSQVIVLNLASTEPACDPALERLDWAAFQRRLVEKNFAVPPSTLYAIAAIESGHPSVNFTPSVGSNLDAIRELAGLKAVCHVGRDGKTGETFLKSVLAPAFAARNLNILSWVGHNIFGNMDGLVLDDPTNKSTKVKSKDSLLGNILGYTPQTHTSIEYIASLGDWKTAWDHIHFRGFLGTPMIMQFIWQGCDSILAAPLVIDLIRFIAVAAKRGEVGEIAWLASFFKSPQGTAESEFARQYALLEAWAQQFESV